MNKTKLRGAWARLMRAQTFVLACHQRPDGDTLGSALALASALQRCGKDVVVVSEDGVPDNYAFIPGSDTVVTSTDRRDFDIGALVDSEGANRVGTASEAVTSARTTACIDHHVPDGEFGDIRVVDRHASATSEVVFRLLDANDIAIDRDTAVQLLTGIVADTGAFRFPNTSPETLRIAARLTELGAEPSVVVREVYESRSLHATNLLGRALASTTTEADGRIVWAEVTHRDMTELGATDTDTESIVNQVRSVRGARVAILFREVEPNSVRVSLRSKDGLDVNLIARAFGGGGHVAASGCTVDAPLPEARRRVLDEVLKWMGS